MPCSLSNSAGRECTHTSTFHGESPWQPLISPLRNTTLVTPGTIFIINKAESVGEALQVAVFMRGVASLPSSCSSHATLGLLGALGGCNLHLFLPSQGMASTMVVSTADRLPRLAWPAQSHYLPLLDGPDGARSALNAAQWPHASIQGLDGDIRHVAH